MSGSEDIVETVIFLVFESSLDLEDIKQLLSYNTQADVAPPYQSLVKKTASLHKILLLVFLPAQSPVGLLVEH